MSAIKAGDLVMIVRPTLCCGDASSIGTVFTVKEVWINRSRCHGCGAFHEEMQLANNLPRSIENAGWMASRLIRIDPPALTDDTTTERELTTS